MAEVGKKLDEQGPSEASMSASARAVEGALPGYPSPVRSAIMLLGDEQQPRQHFTGDGESSCWELGQA